MRILQVQFTSGRDVLSHYWGLLSGGGLAIELGPKETPAPAVCALPPDPLEGDEFSPGETLGLMVHVCSIKKTYELDVQVRDVRRTEEGTGHMMVSFLPHTPPDELLDAAWADGCDAPQRRSRRLPLQATVQYDRLDGKGMERSGRLLNLSSGGCCVEGSALPPPGTHVVLTLLPPAGAAADGPDGDEEEPGRPVRLTGRVRWTERPEGGLMGIEFVGHTPEISAILQTLTGFGTQVAGRRSF